MAHYPIDHSDVPIRLFKSDFLEFFTHISPVVVVIIWLPVAVAFMALEVLSGGYIARGVGYLVGGFFVGVFLWTFAEYTLHRFLFHYQPKDPKWERIFFLFHGVHHAQPQCKTRLVMPPVVSIPMAFIMYGIISLIFSTLLGLPHWVFPVMSGFIVGYLFYDLTHYATHHFPMRRGIWKYLKRYHMQHHYKTPNARFGVSSPLWDVVFGTKPAD
ncbi:sterol desaturase family protein [Anaerolinea sp.]|uniref:sterol desaturase family protein n=1 Tax=Anaerolinea sp. TaxID=1872519 RepID=UPI002ACE2A37|nr:sterol desaturase family protein [Anaerolinea sp.]